MEKLVYPWNSQKCRAPQSVKAEIWGDLFNDDSRCLKYREAENIPDKRVLTMIEDVYRKVESGKWVVITCDKIKFLQLFNEVFPMVYSFTSRYRVLSVTTDSLISIFSDKEYVDNYLQNKLTKKEKLMLHPMLFWGGILTEVKWGKGYSGNIAGILQEKVKRGGLVVATTHYSEDYDSDFSSMFLEDAESVWGDQIKSILQEMVVFMRYRIHTDPEISSFNRDI